MKDEKWLDGYRRYVKDNIFKNGNPEKGPINREIGSASAQTLVALSKWVTTTSPLR